MQTTNVCRQCSRIIAPSQPDDCVFTALGSTEVDGEQASRWYVQSIVPWRFKKILCAEVEEWMSGKTADGDIGRTNPVPCFAYDEDCKSYLRAVRDHVKNSTRFKTVSSAYFLSKPEDSHEIRRDWDEYVMHLTALSPRAVLLQALCLSDHKDAARYKTLPSIVFMLFREEGHATGLKYHVHRYTLAGVEKKRPRSP
jgi:hypothetical protein